MSKGYLQEREGGERENGYEGKQISFDYANTLNCVLHLHILHALH